MKLALRKLASGCLSVVALVAFSRAEAPPAEKQKIESLLAKVDALQDATFIRNGSSYDAKSAVKFMRAKWSRSDSEIKTAKDFIDKAGTGSGTSGKPYLIKFKDGREVPCGDYLKTELAKIDGK